MVDKVLLKLVAEVEFFSAANLGDIATSGLKGGATALVSALGTMVLKKLFNIKSDQDQIIERLGEIERKIDKLQEYVKDENIGARLEAYIKESQTVRDRCSSLMADIESSAPTVDQVCEHFTLKSDPVGSWQNLSRDLTHKFTGFQEISKIFGGRTKSTLQAYSTRLIEQNIPLKEYVEYLCAFYADFASRLLLIQATVVASARYLQMRKRPLPRETEVFLTKKQADECVDAAVKECQESLAAVQKYMYDTNPNAFDLYRTLWGEGRAFRGWLVNSGSEMHSLGVKIIVDAREGPHVQAAAGQHTNDRNRFWEWEIIPEGAAPEGWVRLRMLAHFPGCFLGWWKTPTNQPGMGDVRWWAGPGWYTSPISQWALIAAAHPNTVLRASSGSGLAQSREDANVCDLHSPANTGDAKMHWRLIPSYQVTRRFGSKHLNFDDLVQSELKITGVAGVDVWSTDHQVGGLQFRYRVEGGGTRQAQPHGSSGYKHPSFELKAGEELTEIRGGCGSVLDWIQFVTNKRESPVYGKKGGVPFVAKGPFLAFFGGASGGIDSIGVYWNKPAPRPTRSYGRANADDFDDLAAVDSLITGIKKIRIWLGDYHGPVICSFQVTYRLSDGTFHEALRHGRTGSEILPFEFEEGEVLIGIKGMYADCLMGIQFFTNKKSSPYYGREISQGPSNTTFHVRGQFLAFFGRQGDVVAAIGAHETTNLTPRATAVLGAEGGTWFDDLETLDGPPRGIERIAIYTENNVVRGVCVDYIMEGGEVIRTPVRGMSAGVEHHVEVGADHDITAISGRTTNLLVQITFEITNRLTGHVRTEGPFGASDDRGGMGHFQEKGKVVAFFGRAAWGVDAIGMYMTEGTGPRT